MRSLLLSLTLFFVPAFAWSQVKFERESRLRVSEVPSSAVAFIEKAAISTKIKWYFEENEAGNSVEAKFRHQASDYSVEFDTSGLIQDIEIKIDLSELSALQQQAINTALGALFTKYRIRKIQRQYRGSTEDLLRVMQLVGVVSNNQIRYELVVKGRDSNGVNLYEITFDEEGQLLQKRLIIFRNAEHLEY